MKKNPISHILIFWQSIIATLGSLYYSNFGDPIFNLSQGNLTGVGLDPCHLCWWARILMYPIVFISGVALLKKDKNLPIYVLPFALFGVLLEIYHYLLQKLPIQTSEMCTLVNPCDALKVNYLGFITIPFLCLVAFTVITVAAVHSYKKNQ